MNFLEKIKEDIANIRNQEGMRRKVAVDAASLARLIEDYERIDSKVRSHHFAIEWAATPPHQVLEAAVDNFWRANNHSSIKTLQYVMNILSSKEIDRENIRMILARNGEDTGDRGRSCTRDECPGRRL